ncbi:hypothetical protein DRN73_07640 [Candidatus Pacearchaeota archaeon]|nr:MAG: hypothetical protein DRN73_07640 [Candidatus Pacearchaeota archaeon]
MKDKGIGEGKTREDHADLLNQLFACYAKGKEVRELAVILGEEALTDLDKRYLAFAEDFEREFVNQGEFEDRSVIDTLEIGWKLLRKHFKDYKGELKRIRPKFMKKYFDRDETA